VIFNEPNFGQASSFVTGKYPNYMISPINNFTDPGVYEVAFSLWDDNPDPRGSLYSFKITVMPMAPGKDLVSLLNKTIIAKNKTIPSKKLIVKLKSISNSGLATITFNTPLIIPANISAIDN
jgi:hypothetical protein